MLVLSLILEREELFKKALIKRASVNFCDFDGNPIVFFAAKISDKYPIFLKSILAKSANIRNVYNEQGVPFLHYLCEIGISSEISPVLNKRSIKVRLNINEYDKNGQTALIKAVKSENKTMIKVF